MKVFVYYNLHKKLWSIKAMEGDHKNKIIGHSNYVLLSDAKAKVSKAGRERVLKDNQKNVHAGITGTLESTEESNQSLLRGVSYNPYFNDYFYYLDDKSQFTGCNLIYLHDKQVNEI